MSTLNTGSKINTLIIEDEQDAIDLLSSILKEYCPEITIVGVAQNVDEGVAKINELSPALVLMDVSLGEDKCFEILGKIPEPDFLLVFTTAYSQFAFDAFQYNAVHYMLKPYSISETRKMIAKVVDAKLLMEAKKDKTLTISSLSESLILNLEDICFIEASRAYCTVYTNSNKSYVVSKSLAEMEKEISNSHFIRPHVSYLINVNSVVKLHRMDENNLEMKNGQKVPVARNKREMIKSLF